ncbi:MAG TPA: urease accessory protein UreE [Microvirga sp.]|jgi:urease accessory protein|nr:urease accessory protein UreE [Microvirga sp.]
MLRATSIVRKAAVKAERVTDSVTLDHEGRNRRRIALKGDGGLDFLLDLDKASVLNDGDAVKLEDGRLVQVRAAPQRLLEVRAENPLRLLKVAYHVGNRHTPAEVTADAVYIEDDHVLAEMVRGQGCTATLVMRPFQPERGAYEHDCGHDHGHGHHHGHDHGHAHSHSESHAHGHAHAHAEAHAHAGHGHAHGAACGCGHDHAHSHSHDHHGHDQAHGHAHDDHRGHDRHDGHDHHGHKHGA